MITTTFCNISHGEKDNESLSWSKDVRMENDLAKRRVKLYTRERAIAIAFDFRAGLYQVCVAGEKEDPAESRKNSLRQ